MPKIVATKFCLQRQRPLHVHARWESCLRWPSENVKNIAYDFNFTRLPLAPIPLFVFTPEMAAKQFPVFSASLVISLSAQHQAVKSYNNKYNCKPAILLFMRERNSSMLMVILTSSHQFLIVGKLNYLSG